MVMLRNADVFVKPRHDLRSKSAAGGIITLIAGSAAILLFFAQLYMYLVGTTSHSLHLTESKTIPMLPGRKIQPVHKPAGTFDIRGKMRFKMHITFPHIACNNLEVKLNGANLVATDFEYKSQNTIRRRPYPTENVAAGVPPTHKEGCTIETYLRVPIVAGHVTITLTRGAWSEALNHLMVRSQYSEEQKRKDTKIKKFNMTHFIHVIQFGKRYPMATTYPLEKRMHLIDNEMGGIALENIQVKLVPTVYSGFFAGQRTYQASVVTHTVQPDTMVAQGISLLPGLALQYDLTPLAVHHVDGRDNFFVFMSSLVSIVGGVFVTVGLLTGCLVHSAAAVAKKVD